MPQPERLIYPEDLLTAEERLLAVVRLQEPDRVPLSMMVYYYGPFHTGAPVVRNIFRLNWT